MQAAMAQYPGLTAQGRNGLGVTLLNEPGAVAQVRTALQALRGSKGRYSVNAYRGNLCRSATAAIANPVGKRTGPAARQCDLAGARGRQCLGPVDIQMFQQSDAPSHPGPANTRNESR